MNTIITISRQHGSAGLQIGRELAKELNIPCYDKSFWKEQRKTADSVKKSLKQMRKSPPAVFCILW